MMICRHDPVYGKTHQVLSICFDWYVVLWNIICKMWRKKTKCEGARRAWLCSNPTVPLGRTRGKKCSYLFLTISSLKFRQEGLSKPIFLHFNTNLTSIKRNNNTNTHYGEMAMWQMRGVMVNSEMNWWIESGINKDKLYLSFWHVGYWSVF